MNFDAGNIYLNYFRLDASAYRDKVRFYEENPKAISSLYFDERIESEGMKDFYPKLILSWSQS